MRILIVSSFATLVAICAIGTWALAKDIGNGLDDLVLRTEPSFVISLKPTNGLTKAVGIQIEGCLPPESPPLKLLPGGTTMGEIHAKKIFGLMVDNSGCQVSAPAFAGPGPFVIASEGAVQTDPVKAFVVVGSPTICLVAYGDQCLIAGKKLTVE